MKLALYGTAAAMAVIGLCGCSSGSEMSSNEVNALKSPNKSGPPPSAANMDIAGKVQAQKDANAKAGVDDQGVPLKK